MTIYFYNLRDIFCPCNQGFPVHYQSNIHNKISKFHANVFLTINPKSCENLRKKARLVSALPFPSAHAKAKSARARNETAAP